MAMLQVLEPLLLRMPQGLCSRLRIALYKLLGMQVGPGNRMEKSRCRRVSQISIGSNNAFTQGLMLWPQDAAYEGLRIKIGNKNYFNRNAMLDACGHIEIGSFNMFGPDVYITDSNHTYGMGLSPAAQPMQSGTVRIGDHCWIGAKAVILKDVQLGDHCVVAAGAVVTKSFPAGSVIGGVPAKLLRTV
jgi:acetyltransferase-like isoleucine patch superfamily enzyme